MCFVRDAVGVDLRTGTAVKIGYLEDEAGGVEENISQEHDTEMVNLGVGPLQMVGAESGNT